MFRTFSRRFAHRWEKTFTCTKARKVWFADLQRASITDEMVMAGLETCSELDWPPSVGEFIKYCRPTAEDMGLPNCKVAFDEVVRALNNDYHKFSHPIVFHAMTETGRQEFRRLPESKCRQLFERVYTILVRRVARGEALDEAIPKALPSKVVTRNRSVALKHLAGLKTELRGA